MPVFEYKGLSEAGKAVGGLKEADTVKGLRAQLRREGIFLTEVLGQADRVSAGKTRRRGGKTLDTSREVDVRRFTRGRITTDDIAIATRQLATLLGAGVTLVEALTALVDQTEKERLKRIISDVKQRVNEGGSLADSLAVHQKVFGSLYVNMVRAGEHSGALDAVLTRLADFTEGQARLRQRVFGTLMYPAVMMVIGGAVLIIMMTVVVPKVTTVFDSVQATLPVTTRLLIWTTEAMQQYGLIILPLFVLAVFGFVRWTKSERGRPHWDRLLLRTWQIGDLVRMLAIARFTRTLSTLLKSGVPLLTAMDIVRNVITNSVLADVIDKAKEAIREGESIAGPLKRSGEFPPLVHHMISIGERSGALEEMLLNVADSYESQVNVRLGAMTALLEPILIVVMGGTIAFVTFSILMPILQINSAIR